eukprot:CAMPEP_0118912454 /NCGR_PEP_ID=MMETSP1166-20130328/13695_1 /TAXON_ID=1104430 /ORGANISM="Chrysoreinhardia sp, Strain CCMP3193" /LENGTH=162 /DNA_ID=CAMNT_0006851973 /DNA_START=54 /DNA_END=539 /DNA_ORIENTATION=-
MPTERLVRGATSLAVLVLTPPRLRAARDSHIAALFAMTGPYLAVSFVSPLEIARIPRSSSGAAGGIGRRSFWRSASLLVQARHEAGEGRGLAKTGLEYAPANQCAEEPESREEVAFGLPWRASSRTAVARAHLSTRWQVRWSARTLYCASASRCLLPPAPPL